MKVQPKLQVTELVDKFMLHLEGIGYSSSTREHAYAYYRVFLKYAERCGIQYFSLDIGKQFLLEHHGHQWVDTEKLTDYQNYLQRLMQQLHEFQMHGIISKRRITRYYSIPYFEEVLSDYLEQERGRGLKEVSIAGKRHILNNLFEYLEQAGLKKTNDILPTHIFGFLESRTHFSVSTKENYQYIIRGLIKYLHNKGLCRPELTKLFTVISLHSKNAYPSYFTPGDVAKVLHCVDTTTVGGKRDYLILLLAAELGIRASDICALKLENISFPKKQIEFVQEKTGNTITLPMSEELFFAFADYIKNARPESDAEEVIIKGRAPIEPFQHRTFHDTLKKYLLLAVVQPAAGEKQGLRSLRSSLASSMLRNGVPVIVISNVLGHKYADTTNFHYLKIDLDGLRKAALEVPVL